ncbi:hypothetical protein Tco_1243749 [Tanacetum coccineum]
MSTQQDINAIRAQRLANTHDPLALIANTQTPFHPDQSSHITYIQHPQLNNNFVLQPSFNTNYMQQPMQNLEDISDPTTALDMALELMFKAFQLNNTTITNNNQRSSSNPSYSQIAQSSMNIDQDRQMQMVNDNVGNQFRENAMQNVGHLVGQNAVQNQGTQNVRNQNGLSVVPGIAYQHGNGNVVAAWTEEEQYTELLEPIPEPHQVQQNNSNVISAVSSVEQSGGILEQHPVNVEETRVLYDSLYNNLAIEVEKVNSVNRIVQNFDIQFLKEATEFVRDFQSLAKEANESLAKHKALELKIKRLLRAVVSQDIMSIVQSYYDMQQKIERLQAQLGDLKGKSKDTLCVSNTLDLLSQKLENENVSEQKDTTKGTSVNTQFRKQSILGKPPSSSSGPKLYFVTPLPKSKVIIKVGESNALSKLVTSNSAPFSRESIVVNNEKVTAPRIFRINPFKALRVDNFVPNKHVKASARTKPITVSQPHVITKKDVNFITNGFSSKNIESTTRTRRPQLMNNLKSDKVPFKSKSSCLSNKLEKIKENHRSLQSSDYPDHTSYACNNIKLTIQNEKYEVICATCKQYLITANHDEYVLQYVNGMKYRTTNQSANVSKSANQQKQKANVKKSKMLSSEDRLTLSRPSKPRTCLKWLPTGRIFDLCGKITPSSNTESESDTSVCDNASASNPQEPTNKGFPSSTSFLGRFLKLQRQNSCIYPLAIF